MKRLKISSVILAIILLLNVLCVYADTDSSSVYTFSFTVSGNEATITGFDKIPTTPTDIIIPGTISDGTGNAYKVVAIGDKAFAHDTDFPNGCSYIKSVTISDNIKSIGSNAFYMCRAMEKADISHTVETIGSSAFKGCSALYNIELKEGLKTISSQAFYFCIALRNIVIPKTVTSIGSSILATSRNTMRVTVLSDCSDGLSNNAFSKVGAYVEGGTVYNVVSEAVKTKMVENGITESNINVYPGKYIALLYPGYGYNIPELVSTDSNVTLPVLEDRIRFKFKGWTDDINNYNAGDALKLNSNRKLTALWEYDSSVETEISLEEIEDSIHNTDEMNNLIFRENEVSNTESISVSVNENHVINTVNKDIFGLQYETSGYSPFIDLNTLESGTPALTQEYLDFAQNVSYKVPIARWGGHYANGVNALSNLADFKDRKQSINVETGEVVNEKVVYGQLEYIKSVLAVNPDAKFIFVLGMDVQTPEESAQFVQFLTDDKDASEWGALRASLGVENPINIAGLELGNEQYISLVDLTESEDNYNTIVNTATEYCTLAKSHIDAIRKVNKDVILIPNLNGRSGATDYFADIWTRTIIQQLDEYCDGVYTVHFYYGINGRETALKRILDNIVDIYHQERGYDRDIKFAVTEHAYTSSLGETKHEYTSLIGALSDASFFSVILERDDIFCSNYHNVYGDSWSSIKVVDGKIYPSAIMDLYKLYLDKIGDKVVEWETVDYGTSHIADKEYGGKKFVMNATVKGENQLVLILVNTSSNTSLDIRFDFNNQYSLIDETFFTAPNMYSKKINADTLDVFDIKTDNTIIENFSEYTMDAESIVFLTLETTENIKSSDIENNVYEKGTVLYHNLLDGLVCDDENVFCINDFKNVDRILYNGTNKDFAVYASKDKEKWYLLTDYDLLYNGSWLNPAPEQEYRFLKITGADEHETAVLGEVDSKIMIPSFTEGIRLYPRVEGTDYFNNYTCTVSDNNTLDVKDNLINVISNYGSQSVSVSAGESVFEFSISVFSPENYYAFSEDFEELPIKEETITPGLKWDGWTFETEAADIVAAVENGNITMDGNYLNLGYDENGDDVFAYKTGEHAQNSNRQIIRFDVQRSKISVYFKFRFMIHNDGKNYYEFKWNRWLADDFSDLWTLTKVSNGTESLISKGMANTQKLGAGNTISFEFVIDGGNISWTADYKDYNNGYPVYQLNGNGVDESPFDVTDTTTTFGFGRNGKGYLLLDNISFEMLIPDDDVFKASVCDGGIQIIGTNSEAINCGQIIVPESIGGKAVVSIADNAFSETNAETVILPESVRNIDFGAFESCTNLKTVYLNSEELDSVKGAEYMNEFSATVYVKLQNVRNALIDSGCDYNRVLYKDKITVDFTDNAVSVISPYDISKMELIIGCYNGLDMLADSYVYTLENVIANQRVFQPIDSTDYARKRVFVVDDLSNIKPLTYSVSKN